MSQATPKPAPSNQREKLREEVIAARLCIDKVAVCRRLPDLEKASLARPNGLTVPTVSGRRQRVWEGCNG